MAGQSPDDGSIDLLITLIASAEYRQVCQLLVSEGGLWPELTAEYGLSVEDLDELLANLIRAGIVRKVETPEGTLYTATDRLDVECADRSMTIRLSTSRGAMIEVQYPVEDDVID